MQRRKINNRYTRRDFFRFLLATLSVSALFWWLIVGGRDRSKLAHRTFVFTASNIPFGISFHEQIVMVRNKDTLKAYEAKCTHLGCRINKAEGQVLVCQCHGSRFDMSGDVVQGPASRPLKELKIRENIETGNLEIDLAG